MRMGVMVLTIVTSMVLFVPVLRSHNNTNSVGFISSILFTSLVPSKTRKLKQMPSTDVPGRIIRFSSRMVMRAQFSSSIAWFGQHSIGAGNFGGATRLDGSRLRQSPRGIHGGERQLSCNVGTHTSCESHPLVTFERRQLFNPHQTFEHFGLSFTQMHALQFVSSSWSSIVLEAIGLYGESDVVFKQTDEGSDSTGKRIFCQHLLSTVKLYWIVGASI